MFRYLKRFFIGRPLPTHAAQHQRIGNVVALAVFASDALSSVAYATEEILLVLSGASAGPTLERTIIGIAIAIVALLGIVVLSYAQTIHAYPNGGGAYVVAKENLGPLPGLTAGGALLVDYVLTAAVSVAAGVAAITSAAPVLAEHRVAIAGAVLFLLVVINLRGVKESGAAFAAPTYAFIVILGSLIVVGLMRRPEPSQVPMSDGISSSLGVWIILRAFASGCTALTGVEAVSNGVTAFRAPEPRNATSTLVRMALILGALFIGVTMLAINYGVTPKPDETVVSQIARHVFGTSPLYYTVQAATAMILLLAANTSFAGFPRLTSLMAKDRYLPRQLASQGDRLAFSNGIILLGFASWLLIFLFRGNVHALIPLYAVGVFLSFTLSQAGMVAHWWRLRGKGWVAHAAVNLVGVSATGAVLVVVVATKFTHGAWVVCLVIPGLVFWFSRINRHYGSVERQLVIQAPAPSREPLRHTVIVPVAGMHRGVLRALRYAQSISPRIRAVTVGSDPARWEEMQREWAKWAPEIPLVILDSPYRAIVEPLVQYLDLVEAEQQEDLLTVVIPEFIPKRLWHRMLHNQTALLLIAALSSRPNIVVTTVRIRLDD